MTNFASPIWVLGQVQSRLQFQWPLPTLWVRFDCRSTSNNHSDHCEIVTRHHLAKVDVADMPLTCHGGVGCHVAWLESASRKKQVSRS